MYKAWIVLITCANSRVIHLDLVPDCTGESCIDALKRFVNKHGAPNVIVSDNGKNFISKDVQEFAVNQGITWKFNIENAPWYGGIYERLVRSVKRCLRKILTNSRISYDQMLTTLCEIENVLNNRPLTYLYSENDMIEPITPNKLLHGHNIYTFVNENRDIKQVNGMDIAVKRYHYICKLLEHFWCRWHREYLVELREHQKSQSRNSSFHPHVGDVVVVKDDNLKRIDWRIGKINELIISKDGKIRAAQIDVASNGKVFRTKRPINKLFPIELNIEQKQIQPKFVDESDIPNLVVAGGNVR